MDNQNELHGKNLGDIHSTKDIRLMVDSFYDKARQDELLGPVFEKEITNWETHFPTMYGFWEKRLFGKGDYDGNPLKKHLPLNIGKEHFERWVKLFIESIDINFSGTNTEKAKEFVKMASKTFQLQMGIKNF